MIKLEKQDIIIIVVCVVFLIGFIVSLAVFPKDEVVAAKQSSDTIEETNIAETINVEDNNAMYNDYLNTIHDVEPLTITSTEIVDEITEKQKIVVNELNALKAGKKDIVKKYFGESNVFSADIVADRVTPAKISFITNHESSDVIYAHICTLDYHKILKDYLTNNESKITEGILNNEYNICYTISLSVNEDNSVNITESFKEAITGGWYQSDAEPVDCILA